jgi:hypothetical protein
MECLYCRAPLSVEASERGLAYCSDEHRQLKVIEERLGIGSHAGRPGPSAAPVARPSGFPTIGSPPDPAARSAQDAEPEMGEGLARLNSAVSETQVRLSTAGPEENAPTPHRNVCQVCERPIPFPMRLVGSEFCSAKHKREAERRNAEQVLERLQSDQGNLGDVPRFPNTARVVRIRPPAANGNRREGSPERSVASLGTVGVAEAWRFNEDPIPLPLSATGSAIGNSVEFHRVAPGERALREPGISGANGPARPKMDWVPLGLPTVPPALASRQSSTLLGLEQCGPAFLRQTPVRGARWIATMAAPIEGRGRPSIPAPGPAAVFTRLPGRLSIRMQPRLSVTAGFQGPPHFSDSWDDAGFPARPRVARSQTSAIRLGAPGGSGPRVLSRPNAVKWTPRTAGGGAWTSRSAPPSNARLCQHPVFPAAMPRCGEFIGIGAPAAQGTARRARHCFLAEPGLAPRMLCGPAASPAAWSLSAAAARPTRWHRAAAGIPPAAGGAACWNLESRHAPWMANPEPATEWAVAPPRHPNAIASREAGGWIRASPDLSLPSLAGCTYRLPSGPGSPAGLSVSPARRPPRDGARCEVGLQNEPEPIRGDRQRRLRRSRRIRNRHALDDDSGLGPAYPQSSSRETDSRRAPVSGSGRHSDWARSRPLRTPLGGGAIQTSRRVWHGRRHGLVLELPAVSAGGVRSPAKLPARPRPQRPLATSLARRRRSGGSNSRSDTAGADHLRAGDVVVGSSQKRVERFRTHADRWRTFGRAGAAPAPGPDPRHQARIASRPAATAASSTAAPHPCHADPPFGRLQRS